MANNEKIKPMLLAPTSARILCMTEKESDEVRAVKLFRGEDFEEKKSEYYSYVQKVKSVSDVQKGLYKLWFKYADATHISCGYRLETPQGPFQQGYFDDKETGAGRAILQAIKDRDITCVAVFIIRYYGGIKLGHRRFEIASMLTTTALTTYQYRAQKRSTRSQRELSQDLIASTISTLSGEEEANEVSKVDSAPNTGGTSQDEIFLSANENSGDKP